MEDLIEEVLEDAELSAALRNEDAELDEFLDGVDYGFDLARPAELSWDEPDEDETVWL